MHVGVFLSRQSNLLTDVGLPHACGGVSDGQFPRGNIEQSSPCMWGCFQRGIQYNDTTVVFPMHVGVFPAEPDVIVVQYGLPHACGGVSKVSGEAIRFNESSPCMWGCF